MNQSYQCSFDRNWSDNCCDGNGDDFGCSGGDGNDSDDDDDDDDDDIVIDGDDDNDDDDNDYDNCDDFYVVDCLN